MGKLSLVRVDYRLAHGQVATTWTKVLHADKVVILDDEVVKDKLMMQVMRMGLGTVKLKAYPVEEGIAKWKTDKFGPGNIIVIFREVATAYQAYKAGFAFKALNVGQVPSGENRRRAVATINLSDEEMAMLTELHEAGVEVYNQQTMNEKKFSYSEILASMS